LWLIWYAGPDLAASKLATGRTPQIFKAFRLVPVGVQEGMKTTVIGTRTIDPEKDGFFRVVIEERKKLPKSHSHYLLLKIIANALYGIFPELNKDEYGRTVPNDWRCFLANTNLNSRRWWLSVQENFSFLQQRR